jgi:hypothetical protein
MGGSVGRGGGKLKGDPTGNFEHMVRRRRRRGSREGDEGESSGM